MNALRGKLPLGAVALLLVLVLAAIGLVYGNWSQKLTITGTVGTGSVSAEWNTPIGKVCTENETTKTVGETTLNVIGKKTLAVTLTNVYPNYIGDCEPEIHYTGNIPGVVESITITGKGINCSLDGVGQAPTGTFQATCLDPGTGAPAIQVNWNNGLCSQLSQHLPTDPHVFDKTGSSLLVEVLKTAEQKATYGFNIEIQIVQFDKSAC